MRGYLRIAEDMLARNKPRHALAVTLMRDTYVRVADLLRMKGRGIVCPAGADSPDYACTYNPREEGVISRVGEYDDSVILDRKSREAAKLAARELRVLFCRVGHEDLFDLFDVVLHVGLHGFVAVSDCKGFCSLGQSSLHVVRTSASKRPLWACPIEQSSSSVDARALE